MKKQVPINGGRHRIGSGKETLEFNLVYSDRKTLSINIDPELTVKVLAPIGKPLDEIVSRVKRRAPWIWKQINHFERFHPIQPPRRYVSGETHIYLARQYRLKIIKANSESVKLKGRYLKVHTDDRNDRKKIERLVLEWYREHARLIFAKRLDSCYEIAKKCGVPYPKIRLRRMKKRWGSCSKSGDILLNTELVKAPRYCIEYVIMHELCHLKERNHGKEFYKLLSRCMPDWQRRKEKLEFVII